MIINSERFAFSKHKILKYQKLNELWYTEWSVSSKISSRFHKNIFEAADLIKKRDCKKHSSTLVLTLKEVAQQNLSNKKNIIQNLYLSRRLALVLLPVIRFEQNA